jgi:hypothetical protein
MFIMKDAWLFAQNATSWPDSICWEVSLEIRRWSCFLLMCLWFGRILGIRLTPSSKFGRVASLHKIQRCNLFRKYFLTTWSKMLLGNPFLRVVSWSPNTTPVITPHQVYKTFPTQKDKYAWGMCLKRRVKFLNCTRISGRSWMKVV